MVLYTCLFEQIPKDWDSFLEFLEFFLAKRYSLLIDIFVGKKNYETIADVQFRFTSCKIKWYFIRIISCDDFLFWWFPCTCFPHWVPFLLSQYFFFYDYRYRCYFQWGIFATAIFLFNYSWYHLS